MPRNPSRYPTELELEILKILWHHGPMPTGSIREKLAREAGRDLAPTSVITTLNVMKDKGYVSRKRDGKSYVFRARVREHTVSKGMIGDLVDRVFDGSASALMLRLVESRGVSPQEIEQLEQLVRDLKDNDNAES